MRFRPCDPPSAPPVTPAASPAGSSPACGPCPARSATRRGAGPLGAPEIARERLLRLAGAQQTLDRGVGRRNRMRLPGCPRAAGPGCAPVVVASRASCQASRQGCAGHLIDATKGLHGPYPDSSPGVIGLDAVFAVRHGTRVQVTLLAFVWWPQAVRIQSGSAISLSVIWRSALISSCMTGCDEGLHEGCRRDGHAMAFDTLEQDRDIGRGVAPELDKMDLDGRTLWDPGSQVLRGWTSSQIPSAGRSVRVMTGSGWLPGMRAKENRLRRAVRMIMASCMAKPAPIQMRGPSPKGR